MQTTIELNDAVGPVGSPLPQCVTPPPIPTLESLLGKRHFDDLFEDEVFHAGQQLYLKKCRPVSYSSKTTIGSPGFKRKRTVSFAQNGVSVTRVERREKTLWYSRADLAVMKHTAKRESRQLNLDSTLAPAYGLPNNDYADEDHLPSVAKSLRSQEFDEQRGLERWSSQMLMLSRCVTIVRARTEVHLEQIDQTILGKNDPERIADLYKTASTQAGSFARVLGIVDASVMEAEH